jgi:fatty-acyl-CoA synthase
MYGMRRNDMLYDVLSAMASATQSGHTYLGRGGRETRITYAQLGDAASRLAAALAATGLAKADPLAIILPDPQDFIVAFVACIIAGIVPVPLAPPALRQDLQAHARAIHRILTVTDARAVLTTRTQGGDLQTAFAEVGLQHRVLALEELRALDAGLLPQAALAPDDRCYIQFTSGSVGVPKGAVITYRNLSANLWAIMRDGLDIQPDDLSVSWLPMYHDMGLVGKLLAPLAFAVEMVYFPTLDFVKKPFSWIAMLSRYRATISFAPNFAYMLAAKRPSAESSDIDLTRIRVLGCGAEPINPAVVRRFLETFAPFGLNPNAFMPCYGMAEATLAVTFDSLRRPPSIITIDGAAAEVEHRAVPAAAGARGRELVSCGKVLPGSELSVRDRRARPVVDGHIGEIWLKGPGMTAGYVNNPEASAAAMQDGWFKTGDLGFLMADEIFIAGRVKDLIIVNGRNFAAIDFEWQVEALPEIREGHVVAFAVPGADTESVVVVAETNRGADLDGLPARIRSVIYGALSQPVRDVVLVPRGTLPKTTSGKIRRVETRRAYLAGEIAPAFLPPARAAPLEQGA